MESFSGSKKGLEFTKRRDSETKGFGDRDYRPENGNHPTVHLRDQRRRREPRVRLDSCLSKPNGREIWPESSLGDFNDQSWSFRDRSTMTSNPDTVACDGPTRRWDSLSGKRGGGVESREKKLEKRKKRWLLYKT
ncbi:hypothetical protein COLO4_19549 [Corchorus olitorius]|uniref:Uncharacterized protein n=1 Tax=Corchorus olitorius TaxID=93759 RepID=A0A1R3J4W8_9ROSI|nr:hypothetical protein COLO4_19549 [Corchorus olitorius]